MAFFPTSRHIFFPLNFSFFLVSSTPHETGTPLRFPCRPVRSACTCLVVQLRAAPVAALLVPLDAVASAKTNPVRHGLVLVDLLGVLLLHGQRLEASHLLWVLPTFLALEVLHYQGVRGIRLHQLESSTRSHVHPHPRSLNGSIRSRPSHSLAWVCQKKKVCIDCFSLFCSIFTDLSLSQPQDGDRQQTSRWRMLFRQHGVCLHHLHQLHGPLAQG